MTDGAAPGPIDFVLIEFPDAAPTAPVADALGDVVESGIIRLYDVAAVQRKGDGTVVRLGLDGTVPALGAFAAFAGAQSGLFDDTDIQDAGGILEPGTSALMIAFENAWASSFVTAAHAVGGRLVASERIPAQVLLDALDAAEA